MPQKPLSEIRPDLAAAARERQAAVGSETKLRIAFYEKGFFDALRLAAGHARTCAESCEANFAKGFHPKDPDQWNAKQKAEHWRILEKSILADIRIQATPKRLKRRRANADSGDNSPNQSDALPTQTMPKKGKLLRYKADVDLGDDTPRESDV